MKKSLLISLIALLIVSIVAFGFVLAENSTNATGITTVTLPRVTNTLNSTSGNSTGNISTVNKTAINPEKKGTHNRTIAPPIPANRTGGESSEKHPPVTAIHTEDRTLPYPSEGIKNNEEINWGRSVSLSNELQCRINFNVGVINSMISASPNSSSDLHPVAAKLQEDLSQIQSIDNTTNVSELAGNYASDMKSVVGTVNSWKSQEGDKMPLRVRAELVTSYRQLSASYEQCQVQAYFNISQQRVNEYQNQLNNYQNQSNRLADKGFDTGSLDQLLQSAQDQIITPLQVSLANANSSSGIKTALGSYCLLDGCVNGTNFHLEAKFNIARVNLVLSDLQANADAFGLDNAIIAQAQQYLANAQSTLDSVGTSVYQKGQSQTISSNIQQASKLVVQLMTQVLKQPVGGLK